MNHSTRYVYPLVAHSGRSIAELVRLGRYEYFNPLINDNNFSSVPRDIQAEVLCFGEHRRNADMPRRIAGTNRQAGTMSDLLELRVQYPDLSLVDPIVAPGAVFVNAEGQRYIGCIFEFAGEPNLGVIWEREVWSPRYRFLVVA